MSYEHLWSLAGGVARSVTAAKGTDPDAAERLRIKRAAQVEAAIGRPRLSVVSDESGELADFGTHLTEPRTNEDWQERALCAQTDPEAFFPEKGGSTREAKKICQRCPVRAECLEYALANDERFGIWGGLSERERRRLKRGIS